MQPHVDALGEHIKFWNASHLCGLTTFDPFLPVRLHNRFMRAHWMFTHFLFFFFLILVLRTLRPDPAWPTWLKHKVNFDNALILLKPRYSLPVSSPSLVFRLFSLARPVSSPLLVRSFLYRSRSTSLASGVVCVRRLIGFSLTRLRCRWHPPNISPIFFLFLADNDPSTNHRWCPDNLFSIFLDCY